jgi:predicted lipoprotein with Yx(FWY)xxD motif
VASKREKAQTFNDQEVRVSKTLTLAGAATMAALLAGCGSSSSTTTSTTTATSPTTATQATSTASTSTAAPASTSSASGEMVVTKHGKLGTILAAGSKRMTVYLFEADKGSESTCSGACAGVWPPVTTSGSPQASGAAMAADLGTIKRSDGTTQVTYKGHPLYYYAQDKDDGDAYGEGVKSFGASWYVLAPSGNKIDHDKGGGGS